MGVLGAVIGSFLNVVVYRIPRGLSIGRPRWSFCPCCGHSIRPHHNVPVLSWLLLRGRCADCRAPISMVYPAVECLTALVFISIWDALFIARVVPGVGSVPASWLLALSYLVLFAALIACSAMDIDQYIVDIRICLLVVVVGVLLNGFAGLPSEADAEPGCRRSPEAGSAAFASPKPVSAMSALPRSVARVADRRGRVPALPPSVCLAALAAGLAWAGTMGVAALLRRRNGTGEEQDSEAVSEESDAGAVSQEQARGGVSEDQGLGATSADATGKISPKASSRSNKSDVLSGATPAIVTDAAGDAGEAAAASSGRYAASREGAADREAASTAGSRAISEPQSPSRFQPLPIVLLSGLLVGLVVWLSVAPAWGAPSVPAGWQRGILTCIALMSALVLTSTVRREADEEVVEEIEAGRTGARAMALRELAWLAPAAIACVIVLAAARQLGAMDADWGSAVRWIEAAFGSGASSGLGASSGTGVFSGWSAPSGWAASSGCACSGRVASLGPAAVHALAAAILAAAMGWTVRILGTLAFGKEAFGTGDIYIMAAIAAAGGFWLLFFAFFLAAILALVGVLATLFWKTHRAIPFGPWLSLGAMVAIWLQGTLVRFAEPAGSLLWSVLNGRGMAAMGG